MDLLFCQRTEPQPHPLRFLFSGSPPGMLRTVCGQAGVAHELLLGVLRAKHLRCIRLIPYGKLTQQWNITILNRKYIFNPGPCFIAMLVYRSVNIETNEPRTKMLINYFPLNPGCLRGILILDYLNIPIYNNWDKV